MIAIDEGNTLESRDDTTVEECKAACRQTPDCKSFARCSFDNTCHLKDKSFDASYTDTKEHSGGCATYFECGE